MLDVFVTSHDRHGPVRVHAGGTPVNAALAIGPGATVIGRVGDDASAAAVRVALAGVDLRLTVDDELPTGTYVELADGTVHADRGANARLTTADVLPLDFDAVLVSGYVSCAADVLAQTDARWRAFVATPLTTALPASANVAFANDDEASRLELSGLEIAVVTHGPHGATVYRDGKSVTIPPTGDTATGAGDRFAGTFLASL